MRALACLVLLALALPAEAQIHLTRSAVGGGAVAAAGGAYTAVGTIGEPAVGTASGGAFVLCQGLGCGGGTVDIHLTLTVLLQGAYDTGGAMRTSLQTAGAIPLAQPYADPAYDGTPLDHDGAEAVGVVPADAVDWVLVELRTSTAPADEVAAAAGLLRADGTVTIAFPGLAAGSYHVVARHRNHAAAISAATVAVSSSGGALDLTAPGAADGAAGVVEVEPGEWALWAADGSADGQVTAPDFNLYGSAAASGATGYVAADYTLDGQVTAPDFNLYNANASAGAASAVPEN